MQRLLISVCYLFESSPAEGLDRCKVQFFTMTTNLMNTNLMNTIGKVSHENHRGYMIFALGDSIHFTFLQNLLHGFSGVYHQTKE